MSLFQLLSVDSGHECGVRCEVFYFSRIVSWSLNFGIQSQKLFQAKFSFAEIVNNKSTVGDAQLKLNHY